MQQQIQAAGLPWFDEDDYDSFRQVLPDRSWHSSYWEWELVANQTLKRLQNEGIRAVKAKVRSAEFVTWCRSTGRDINTDALLAFGNEAAMRDLVGDH